MTRLLRFLAAGLAIPAGPLAGQVPLTPTIEARWMLGPTPFVRDDSTNLAYEVHLTNYASTTLLLTRIEVTGQGGVKLADYSGSQVVSQMARPVPALKLSDGRMIESGRQAVLYLWLRQGRTTPIPSQLIHRLTLSPLQGPAPFLDSTVTFSVPVRPQSAIEIGAPLGAGRWAARFSDNTGGHRRSIWVTRGHGRIAQRFAIDFSMVGPDGKYARDTNSTNESVYGYGMPVLAVAGATVVAAIDTMKDNIPNGPQPNWGMRNALGNYVTLDLGGGRYAMYAHLKPGSVKVRAGQKVKKGETIAVVGNTGSSTGPHLHFQVMDRPDYLEAEGVPYVFDRFEVEGIETIAEFQSGEWQPKPGSATTVISHQLTPNMGIVHFR